MTTTLTERYIAATVKNLPAESQSDVRAELDALIADTIEARIEQGEEHSDAERAALTELGDPGILAASYVDRPLQLIGPKFYLTWLRLLKLLLWIVTPIAVFGVALGQLISEAPLGAVISQPIIVGVSVIVHLSFWVTVVFAILERTGADAVESWDVDQLPEPHETGTGLSDLIASLIFLGLTVCVILWDAKFGFIRQDGEALPILNPDLWPLWMSALLALIAAEMIFAVVLFARRRWSVTLAVVNTALAVSFMSWALTLLVRGDLINTEMIDYVMQVSGIEQDVVRIMAIVLGACFVGFPIWDIIDGWVKRRRDALR